MGLAPYGQLNPAFLDVLRRHIYVDGLDLVMDGNAAGTYRELQAFARRPGQSYESVADIAYTAQHYFSELMLEMLAGLRQLGLSDRLVLTGGCALNSTFNGEVIPAAASRSSTCRRRRRTTAMPSAPRCWPMPKMAAPCRARPSIRPTSARRSTTGS